MEKTTKTIITILRVIEFHIVSKKFLDSGLGKINEMRIKKNLMSPSEVTKFYQPHCFSGFNNMDT